MKTLLALGIYLIFGGVGYADSGGPYEGVPDVKVTENPPVFKIPATKEPLEFYLRHMPRLAWNKKLNEPDSLAWEPIAGCYANFRTLGHVRGHLILELRYISQTRITQGLDYADVLMILAKGQDTQPDANLCRAIYYTSGGVTYNYTARYLPDGDKYGAVVVTRHYSGNGGHIGQIGIRGIEEFDFERFAPSNKRSEQAGAGQPAIRSESKSEGSDEPQPEAEERSR